MALIGIINMFFKFFSKRKAAEQQAQIAKQSIESKPVYTKTNNFDLDFDDSDLRQSVRFDAKPMTAAQMRSIEIWFPALRFFRNPIHSIAVLKRLVRKHYGGIFG